MSWKTQKMKIKLYPYSRGDSEVGLASWACEVVLEMPSNDFSREDLEAFKESVKEIYENWDCDGVQDERGILGERLLDLESHLAYLQGLPKKTSADRIKIKKVFLERVVVQKSLRELDKKFSQEDEDAEKQESD